jgi:hypothetical protein
VNESRRLGHGQVGEIDVDHNTPSLW